MEQQVGQPSTLEMWSLPGSVSWRESWAAGAGGGWRAGVSQCWSLLPGRGGERSPVCLSVSGAKNQAA